MKKILLLSTLILLQYSTTLAQFAGGSGTEADPYQIQTAEQLQEIRNHTDKHFIQITDIDASITETWNNGEGFVSIGDDVIEFTGVYDGDNYTILNLFINTSKKRVGLFGETHSANLKNIKIQNFDIRNSYGVSSTGGLVGYSGSNTTILNSHVAGILSGTVSSGGLVGQNWGLISKSSSDVELTATNINIGGVVGSNWGELRLSVARGSVSSQQNRVGGLAGANNGLIEYSSAHVAVNGGAEVGGLVGLNNSATILNSYSTGKVFGNDDIGGLVGLNSGTVESSYWDTESSEQTLGIGRGSTVGVIGLTTLEMNGKSAEVNMQEFLFEEIWGAVPTGYPQQLWSIPYFQIESLVTNSPITVGQQFTIEVTVNNIGGLADTQSVVLKNTAGDTLDISGNLVLESGQSDTILLQWQSAAGDEGAYRFTVESEYDSQSIEFNVRTIPATVELTSPTNQQGDVSVLPVFTWNQAELATHYQLQVSDVPDFSTTILDSDNLESLTYEVTDSLEYLSTYYWRVRGKGDIGDGDWSDVWSFTTIIQAPGVVSLTAPDDASSNISITPTLQWIAPERAENYRVQLSENAAFTEILQDSSGITDFSYTSVELQFNTTYHWRVKAINTGGESEWSEPRSFFTEFALPTPILEGPETNVDVELPVTFFWHPVTDADTYTLELSTDQSFETVVDLSTSTGKESLDSPKALSGSDYTIAKKVSSLNYDTMYYWRVKAINSSGKSDWSEVRSIQTEPAPIQGTVSLSSPENNSSDVTFPAEVSWQAFSEANHFDVELSESSDFLESQIIKETEDIVTLFSALEDTTTYFWRVRATVNQQKSAWSNVWSFTTELRVPEVPVWKPEDQSEDVSNKPLIAWGSTDRAEAYNLQLSKLSNPDFTAPELDIENVADTSYQVINDLESGETYVWRVRAVNDAGFSEWSESLQFSTELTTSIDETNGLPDKVSLNQNYPNPFNPTTTVSFSLPMSSDVSVEVFNSLGQRVAELVNEIKSAGVHEVSFDASSLSSGIYLIRMSTRDQTFTRKMTLLK